MSFSDTWHRNRNRQIEVLSQKLVGKSINVLIEDTETLVYVNSIINQNTLHHYSSELLFHLGDSPQGDPNNAEQSNERRLLGNPPAIEVWLFIYSGKYKLFQPHTNQSFTILEGDELKKLLG